MYDTTRNFNCHVTRVAIDIQNSAKTLKNIFMENLKSLINNSKKTDDHRNL